MTFLFNFIYGKFLYIVSIPNLYINRFIYDKSASEVFINAVF